MTQNRTAIRIALCAIVLVSSCARTPKPAVEDLRTHENLSAFTLRQVRGTRDGDRLAAQATFGDGASLLTVTLNFAIGAPTTLSSGHWQWSRNGANAEGTVAERSVMFLGGQDGPPSLGGRFDLLDANGAFQYRITIPTTELTLKLR